MKDRNLKFMDVKRIISMSEARTRFFEIADDVQKPGIYYTLTEFGRPKIVILSAEEFSAMLEKRAGKLEKTAMTAKDQYVTWVELAKAVGVGLGGAALSHEKTETRYSSRSASQKKSGKRKNGANATKKSKRIR